MTRGGKLFLSGCLSVFMLLGGWAASAEAEEDALQTLRVGYVPGTGFLEENRPGHMMGNSFEYMEFLAEYGEWQFEYVPCATWWEAGAKLESGEVDILPAMPGDYNSLPFAQRVDHVVARFPMELVVQDNLQKNALRLGTLDYNYPIPSLPAVAKAEGFTYELVEFHDAVEMEKAFSQRYIDGYVDAMLHPEKPDHVLAIFDRVSYRLMVRSDRKELLAKLNYCMDQLLLDQPNIRNRLNDKYGRAKGFPLVLTPEEREFLKNKEKLSVAVLMRQKPYLYKDENGEWQGVIPAVLQQIAGDTGVQIEILEADSLEDVKRMVRRGSVDFVADVPCDFSWLKDLGLAPTQPYMDVHYVQVWRRGNNYLSSPRVAAVRDSFHTKEFVEMSYKEEQILYCDTIEECLKAVSDGKADVTYAPRGMVPHLVESAQVYNLEAETESRFAESVSLGILREADPRLWHILNKEINHLPPGLVNNAAINVAKDTTYHWNPMWLLHHYPLQTSLVILAIMGTALLVFWNRTRMRKRHIEAIQYMAYTNLRYRLPNLLWLENRMEEIREHMKQEPAREPEELMYAVVFDMNSKSSAVEVYGRDLLDRHLRSVAEKLKAKEWVSEVVAGADAGQLVAVCKAGGEGAIRNLVTEAVEEFGYLETAEARVSMHLRAGICPLLKDDFLQEITDRAGTACRELQGRESVRFYDEALKEQLALEQRIEANMEKALERGEFKAWYQPKYDIETRRIVGAEALVRWQSEEMGFMPPGKFIPIFEQNGFVMAVDFALLVQTFELQKRRLAEGKPTVPISVNQSRLHITEEGYLDKMREIVDKYRLPPGLVELEVTETMFGDFDHESHREKAAGVMGELHKLGFTLSLDDFGSGFSSFTMLDYLPLDTMKIDRSILVASDHSERMRHILGNIIELGRTIDMKVICEGIETGEQEKMLLELGCRYGQGYLNSKPLPEQEFIEFLERRNGEVGWDC